eukprot:scaffold20906_cov15-Tisochrysis_lutea.AAC.1
MEGLRKTEGRGARLGVWLTARRIHSLSLMRAGCCASTFQIDSVDAVVRGSQSEIKREAEERHQKIGKQQGSAEAA